MLSPSAGTQSATSPRLMPSKAKPTTALVLDQHQSQQQDNESLSSDDFVLSASAVTKDSQSWKGITSTIHSTLEDLSHLPDHAATVRSSRPDRDSNSESSDEADGRLTDTESEGRERCRTGTPVIAGVAPTVSSPTDHPPSTAVQSLREIEEHDRDDRQIHGIESQFRTALTDHDNNETGDSPDPHPDAALSAVQIQGE